MPEKKKAPASREEQPPEPAAEPAPPGFGAWPAHSHAAMPQSFDPFGASRFFPPPPPHDELARQQAEWARERREFWKRLVDGSLQGILVQGALRGVLSALGEREGGLAPMQKLDLVTVRRTADEALKWFDETFGHDFPLAMPALSLSRRPGPSSTGEP